MKARYWFILILISLLMAACGTSQSDTAPETPPDGEYRSEGTALILTLDQGHFTATGTDTGPLAEGSYSVEGDKITFTEETVTEIAKSFCGTKFTYSYRWIFDKEANQLIFQADNDPCDGRENVHLSGPFVYKPLE